MILGLGVGVYIIKVMEDDGCFFEGEVILYELVYFDFGLMVELGDCG